VSFSVHHDMSEPGPFDDTSSTAATARILADDTVLCQAFPMTDVLCAPRTASWPTDAIDATDATDRKAPVTPIRPDIRVAVPSQHIAQFYETAPFLLDTMREFLDVSLRAGQAAIVIATPAHRAGLEERLGADGLDLDGARASGQYISLDAAETLAALMVDGMPDAARFDALVGTMIVQAKARHQHVRAFGEMVGLLAIDGQVEAAINLERLWNELLQRCTFSLLCAYPISAFGGEQATGVVDQICVEHARVVPAESFATLEDPEERLRAIALLQQKGQALAAEVAERKRAEHALHALFRISQKLHTTLDLDTLLTHIVEESLALVGAIGGCAGLRGADGMVCHGYLHDGERVPLEYCWPPGHGLPGWLLEQKRPYVTNDALRDPQIVPELCLRFGVWSALSIPILDAQGEVLGFFELYNKADGTGFTAADVEKVMAVSQIASVAIQNARLYRETQDAVRLRDELLSTASHELRTPLTTVSAQAQLMLRRIARDGSLDLAAAERAFAMIAQQSGKLTRLIEQFLDVSRLEAGKLTLLRQRTDVSELVERLARTAAVRVGQRVVVQAPAGIWGWVDPLRLDQMVTNLLDNAIKYGAEDRPIEIALIGSADEPSGQIEIAVRDYGPGIPAESRSRLFERFFQAHAEGYKSGMGLGLYISRQIAELHGGQIEAELPPDGGTRFVIRLPAVPPSGSVD